MKISIITTCFNREATIRSAIKSVLAQDYSDVEYIVVDGASKDRSMQIINLYRDQISTIICEPDSGMYEAINKGLRAASGDIIGLMHSDDQFYATDTLTQLAQQIERDGADIIYGDGLFVDAQNNAKVVRNWISGEFHRDNIRNGWLPLHPSVYMRRECFEQMGLYDQSYKIAADSDLMVRYLSSGKFRVSYFRDYVVRMSMGGLSTDPRRLKQKWAEDLRLYRAHGLKPYWALGCKVLSKIPQFISAKFMKSK